MHQGRFPKKTRQILEDEALKLGSWRSKDQEAKQLHGQAKKGGLGYKVAKTPYYQPLLTNTNHYWSLMTTSNQYWSLLITTDHYWSVLITTNHYWPLVTTGDYSHIPGDSRQFQVILVISGESIFQVIPGNSMWFQVIPYDTILFQVITGDS